MLFTSYEFIGFLIVLFVAYYLIPARHQWKLLLIFSYFFYYCANPLYLIYIAATTVAVFFAARGMDRLTGEGKMRATAAEAALPAEEKKRRRAVLKKKKYHLLLLGLIISIGLLAVTKYTNFTIVNINAILRATGSGGQLRLLNIIVPLGISFYTFQAVSYLIDVYRGTVAAEKNICRFALFVSFFPQLIQGPISRYGDLSQSLYGPHSFDKKNLTFGLQRILWGFFKKLVIADRMLVAVNELIRDPDAYGGAYVFAGMLFYALLLYADFTGGIDITIGIAEVLGIKVKENFLRPFFSKSVKEYWRRWHISMGTWFTDYIFYPVTASKPMLKLSKWSRKHLGLAVGKRLPVYLSSFIVWFATGLWHGASWNFIVWGLANWFVIMVSQELEPMYGRFHKCVGMVGAALRKGKGSHGAEQEGGTAAPYRITGCVWYKSFQVVRTVLLMSLIRTFDCYRDVPLTFRMWGSMLTEGNWRILWDGSLLRLGLSAADYVLLFAGLLLLVTASLRQRKAPLRKQLAERPYWQRFTLCFGLFLIVLVFGVYGIGHDGAQFIYNQF